MAPLTRFQVGVVGYGLSAKVFQIPFILASPEFELRAIVQRMGTSAKIDHPTCIIYTDADALFGDATIDLVIIATPPPTHFDLASKALKAGKNVVVEKPFAPTTAECDALIALAKKKNLLLTVFQNRRWDVDFLTLQRIIADGSLGRVVEFETHFDRYDPEAPASWVGRVQPGSGVAYDLGTHLVDQVLMLFGLPNRVTGFLSSQRGISGSGGNTDNGDAEDVLQDACTILLHYQSGLLVTVKASAMSAEVEQLRYWVRGGRGAYRKYHLDPQESQIVANMRITDSGFGEEDPGHAGSLVVCQGGKLAKGIVPSSPAVTYLEFFNELAAALRGDGPVPVAPEAARDVIKIIELAVKSSKGGMTLTV